MSATAISGAPKALLRAVPSPAVQKALAAELLRVVLEILVAVVLEEGIEDELAFANVSSEHRRGDARAPVLQVCGEDKGAG